jgi:hypothetical protein
MKSFKEILIDNQNQKLIESDIMGLVYAMSLPKVAVNESLLTENAVNDFLSKFGLKFHKEGPGLIDYIKDFVKGTGKIFVAALKGDKDEVKRIAQGITKEKVIDFLLKLDTATLHIITGPIHTVDAITGWDLWANVKSQAKKAGNIIHDVWKAIKELKDKIHKALDDRRKQSVMSCITKIEDMVPTPTPQ